MPVPSLLSSVVWDWQDILQSRHYSFRWCGTGSIYASPIITPFGGVGLAGFTPVPSLLSSVVWDWQDLFQYRHYSLRWCGTDRI